MLLESQLKYYFLRVAFHHHLPGVTLKLGGAHPGDVAYCWEDRCRKGACGPQTLLSLPGDLRVLT